MKMTYTKSQYEMPDDKYLAKFLGVVMKDDPPGTPPKLGQDGKPLPPAMHWNFEIAEGEHAGKKTDKLTGRVPTPKSGCGKMLAAVSDSILKDGMEVDLDQFVGKLYRVTVENNRVSDNPAPARVYDSRPVPPPAPATPPPPRPEKVPEPAADTRWKWHDGQAWCMGTAKEFREWVHQTKANLAAVYVLPDDAPPNAPPQFATVFGFDPIPF